MSWNSPKRPLLLERVGVRRVQLSIYISLIPTFSLWRRSNSICVDAYALREKVSDIAGKIGKSPSTAG